jgi:hypothetical protein
MDANDGNHIIYTDASGAIGAGGTIVGDNIDGKLAFQVN